jgi:four helix bundle protein
MLQDFRNLKVWEKGHQLALAIYTVTTKFPKHEMYGLTSQLRRAAGSIPANIAEGCGRSGKAELARFLDISLGSASEVEYHLILAHDLGFLDEKDYRAINTQAVELKRMLTSFILKLRSR